MNMHSYHEFLIFLVETRSLMVPRIELFFQDLCLIFLFKFSVSGVLGVIVLQHVAPEVEREPDCVPQHRVKRVRVFHRKNLFKLKIVTRMIVQVIPIYQ